MVVCDLCEDDDGLRFLCYSYCYSVRVQSCLTLATPWTIGHQAPLPMGFFNQEYWSGLPFLSPRDLPDAGIEPGSPALQADALPAEWQGKHVWSQGQISDSFFSIIYVCYESHGPGTIL